MLHKAIQNRWCRLALAVAATLLYAIGVNWFIVPMGLYTGGLLGFCQVARTLIVEALGLSPNVDFSGILYLAANVPILLLATFFSNISGFYGGIFTAHKDTKIMGTTTLASAVLCLVLDLALIPTIGLYGASIATLVSTLCVNEYRRRKVTKYARLEEDGRELAGMLAGGALVLGCFYVYAYLDLIPALCAGVIAALAFFVIANGAVLRSGVLFVRGNISGGRGRG